MKIKQTTLTVFAAIVVPSQGSAANRGGIQAVVFPKWNSTSANVFLAAVNEATPLSLDSVWRTKMTTILNQLDEPKVLRSGKVNLRRSIWKYSSSLSSIEYRRVGNVIRSPFVLSGTASAPFA
jgi:hypothetical protein